MTELFLTVCLMAAPTTCQDVRAGLYQDLPSCLGSAYPAAQDYVVNHPGSRIGRMVCRPLERRATNGGGTIVPSSM